MTDDHDEGPAMPWEPGALPWWTVAVTDDDTLDPEQLARLFTSEQLIEWLEMLRSERDAK
jgi:hypothetical protein